MDANGEDAMSDANKAVVRKYYELLDAGDIDGLMGILHDDVQWKFHGIGDPSTVARNPSMIATIGFNE